MTTDDLLLEIGVEEVPARFLGPALSSLQDRARSALNDARLDYTDLRTLGTPRRLVLHVAGLAEHQSALEEEVRGPSRQAAYDASGEPTRAALGFARGQGVPVEDLQVRPTPAGEYLYAVRRDPGRPAVEVLPAVLEHVVNSLDFARPMRWGKVDFRFIRPLRWLLALYGGRPLRLEVGGVASGRETYGHRTMAPGAHEAVSVQEYFRLLPGLGVILDENERRQRIAEQVRAMAAATGGSSLDDDELLSEVANLVEYATAFVGSFDRRYLALPAPVLVTTMRHHQRVFPVRSAGGGLLPVFIGVRNGDQHHLDVVRAGYERVIGARLADAEFFFQQDTKVGLADRLPELSRVVFMENLGSLHDKTLRVRELARVLVALAGVREGLSQVIDRAALLCKADLVTAMVRELPELQGIMGREYAARAGEDPAVAEAIYEHYLPRTAEDGLPGQLAGMIVGLADRLDTLAGCFGLGIQPTGSQDPYGLRRQALGVALLLWNSELHLDLKEAVKRAVAGQPLELESPGAVARSVLEFITQRIRTLFVDAGVRPDVVDAVVAAGAREVPDAWRRSTVLAEFARKEEFEALMTGFRRVANLAGRATGDRPEPALLLEEAERELYRALAEVARKVKTRLEARDYQGYLKLLASLKPQIDRFLDDVLVLVPDEDLRKNRLALLGWTLELFSGMADLRLLQPASPG